MRSINFYVIFFQICVNMMKNTEVPHSLENMVVSFKIEVIHQRTKIFVKKCSISSKNLLEFSLTRIQLN